MSGRWLPRITGIGEGALLQEIQRVRDIAPANRQEKAGPRELIPVNQIQPKDRPAAPENAPARAEEGS